MTPASRTNSLLVLIGASVGLAVVLGFVGHTVGVSLAVWKAGLIGLDRLVIASDAEPRGVALATALLFAWPAIVAGVASTIRFVRRGSLPLSAAALYFAIPALAITMATVLQVLSIRSNLGDHELSPMVSMTTLGPGAAEMKVAVFVAAVLWLYVATRRPVDERRTMVG